MSIKECIYFAESLGWNNSEGVKFPQISKGISLQRPNKTIRYDDTIKEYFCYDYNLGDYLFSDSLENLLLMESFD